MNSVPERFLRSLPPSLWAGKGHLLPHRLHPRSARRLRSPPTLPPCARGIAGAPRQDLQTLVSATPRPSPGHAVRPVVRRQSDEGNVWGVGHAVTEGWLSSARPAAGQAGVWPQQEKGRESQVGKAGGRRVTGEWGCQGRLVPAQMRGLPGVPLCQSGLCHHPTVWQTTPKLSVPHSMVIHFIRWARTCCQLPPPSLARSDSGVQAASTPSFLGPAEGLSGPWTVFSWKRLEASTGGNRRPGHFCPCRSHGQTHMAKAGFSSGEHPFPTGRPCWERE